MLPVQYKHTILCILHHMTTIIISNCEYILFINDYKYNNNYAYNLLIFQELFDH